MEGFGVLLPLEAEEEAYDEPRFLDIRYDSDGTLGLQFHAESEPPFAVARITPGSLTAEHPLARAGMVLVSIAGSDVEAGADYGEVLNQLRRSARPLELRFRLPDVEEEEDDHPDGPVEHEGVLRKLERDTSFHRGYTPHPRFFVLRADGLEYFRLFLAGVHGMGDTVTSGAGRALPFSDMQAVVPGTDLPPELINAAPLPGADSPEAASERPHWAVEDQEGDGAWGGGVGGAADVDDPFAQTFALSAPADRPLDRSLEPEREPGSTGLGDGGPGTADVAEDSADGGEECRLTIVMGDRYVGSSGYQKPWRLYRLQAGSESEREAWLGCIRGGMARYREHGPWALRPRAGITAASGLGQQVTHVVSATVARTFIQGSTDRQSDEAGAARTRGAATGTPRAAAAGSDDGVSAGTTTASTLAFVARPYTRYIIEYRTAANMHGEVARRFDEFRQLHSQVLEPVTSPAAPLVMPPAHQATDVLADKNDPELVTYRASELQQYISSAVRLVSRLNAPPVQYALDHFLTHQGTEPHLEQLGGSKAVAELLNRQQLWDAAGHWRGEESAGLLGVTTTDVAGNAIGRRAPAWFGLDLHPDGSAEMTVAHEGCLLAQLLGRWESCGGGRRLRMLLSGSSTVTSGVDRAENNSGEGDSNASAERMGKGGSVGSYCSWGLELTWRKVCVASNGRSADTSREYTVYHILCIQSRVDEDGTSESTGALGSEPEPEGELEPQWRWTVSARYSVFVSLRDLLLSSADKNLSAEIAGLDELFPPKEGAAAWLMPRSSTLGAERQAGLLGWLRAVHRVAPHHPALLAFLAPPQTKSNAAFGDDPHRPGDFNSSNGSHGRKRNHLRSAGTSLPTGSSVSSHGIAGPAISSAVVADAGATRNRVGSDEFIMPDGDDDVYSEYYPDESVRIGGGGGGGRGPARIGRRVARTISDIGIQGLNTPRAADAVEAGAAAAAVAPASPASNSLRGIIGAVDGGAGGASSSALAKADPALLPNVRHAPALKLALASAGQPTVHNAGVSWSDTFGNEVERRRLVLESCLRSDGGASAGRAGGGSDHGDDHNNWHQFAEGETVPLGSACPGVAVPGIFTFAPETETSYQ